MDMFRSSSVNAFGFSIFSIIILTHFKTNAFKPLANIITNKLKLLPSPNHENDGEAKIQISIGFIGCGTIAASIATGLATSEWDDIKINSISVTKRSESKSSALLGRFPDLVKVFDDGEGKSGGQKVADVSDIVFICLLPQQVPKMLSSIKFDPKRHTLVSLASTNGLEELASSSKLPRENVYKMICLPSVATKQGICLVVPKANTKLKSLFESLGGYVECENEEMMKVLMVPTGLMGPFYRLLKNNRDWLVKKGVPDSDASYFITKLYSSMISDAESDCDNPTRLDALIDEQTPGGLNEQSINNLESLDVYKTYDLAMDATLSRLNGETDGSISSV